MRIKPLRIKGRIIGPGKPVFVIAEVGVNHNGSVAMAKKLIDAAKAAGADAVKFQMCDPDEMVTKAAPKAEYQKKNKAQESQYDMLRRYFFDVEEHKVLKAYAQKKRIIFFSTAFSLKDAYKLAKLGMPVWKVGSSDTNNYPQLRIMASTHKPIILSTGMSDLAEVAATVQMLRKAESGPLVVLHCTTAYPTEDVDVNLRAMLTLEKKLRLPVGYSDHTPGIDVAIAAVALGACVIEKHITLSNTLPGPDHFASLEPDAFAELVRAIRRVEKIMGTGIKKPTRSERIIAKIARKSIVAARPIPKGKKITADDLAYKRPGTGMPPSQTNAVLGTRASRDYLPDEQF